MHPCKPLESSVYANYCDSKGFVQLEQLKKEFPEDEYPQLDFNSKMDFEYSSQLMESTEYVNCYDSKDYVLEKVKKEYPEVECPQSDSSMTSKIVSKYPSEPLGSPEYVNCCNSKDYVLEKLKKEYPEDECLQSDSRMTSKIVSKHPSEPLGSPEYVNCCNSKDYVLEKLKKEYPEDECLQSDSSMNSKIFSNIVLYCNTSASVGETAVISERANNMTHRCDDIYISMPKKVTKRSRGSRGVKKDPNVRKVAKTGAERIREYRARIIALENAAAARSASDVEGVAIETASQQNLEDNPVVVRENQRSLLYEALIRQRKQGEQDAGDNHGQMQNLSLLLEAPETITMQMQSSIKKVTKLRRHSKTAKTPAERARAYRERKKALKNATNG